MNETTAAWAPGPAWLFCPADRPDRYIKALNIADIVILDLEDAVAPGRRDVARTLVRSLVADYKLNLNRTILRVNAAGTSDFDADLSLVRQMGIRHVMVAKTESVSDVAELDCGVVALIETARGLREVNAIAGASNVVGLMWGADDLAASMGGTSSRTMSGEYRDVARLARVSVLLAAKAAGLFALDAVLLDIADQGGFRRECEDAVALGFDGTVAIHPAQLPIVRSAYRPTTDRVEWAQRLLAHVAEDRGVTTFEGRMVDGPIFKQAERIINLEALARRRDRGEV